MSTQMNLTCWICKKAVHINDCKFDERNSPVHELCYVARIALESNTRQQGTSPAEN